MLIFSVILSIGLILAKFFINDYSRPSAQNGNHSSPLIDDELVIPIIVILDTVAIMLIGFAVGFMLLYPTPPQIVHIHHNVGFILPNQDVEAGRPQRPPRRFRGP